jgi:hypothetical protein
MSKPVHLSPFECFFLAVMLQGQESLQRIHRMMSNIAGGDLPVKLFDDAVARMVRLKYITITRRGSKMELSDTGGPEEWPLRNTRLTASGRKRAEVG